MLNKKQIIGLCLALPTVVVTCFLPEIIFFGGYIILYPLYIVGVILIIIGSVMKIREAKKEKPLSDNNSDYANKKIILSSIIIILTLCYLFFQMYVIYGAYSGLNESKKAAEDAAKAATQRMLEQGQANNVNGNVPTIHNFR